MKKNKINLEVMDNQTPISSKQVRNWLELPPNVLSLIFLKLGAIDILLRAQLVCSVWRKASKKPLLFRSIDIRNSWDLFEEQCDMMIGRVSFNGSRYDMQKMVREAVDRSCGQLVEFSLESFCCNELLAYTAEKSSSLRCLRLVYCYQVSDDTLINMAKKAAMLEELEICHCSFSVDTLKAVGDLLITCRDRLIKLRFPNDSTDDYEFDAAINDESSEGSYLSNFDHDSDFYHTDSGVDNDSGFNSDSSLGIIDILLRAQLVCSIWRKASKEPLLFRSIDIRNWSGLLEADMYDLEKLAREAVDRSCGQLVEFSMERFGSSDLLAYIADK
ncbi:hypothetical protein MKW92_031600 [Papaver armeniacum]|nr:hypothetical protein MKW92_031600 [Papaver armeniacum]